MPINWGIGEHITIEPWWLVVIFIIGVTFIIQVVKSIFYAKRKFACPACGHRFRKKWYQLLPIMNNGKGVLLNCPECREKNNCSAVWEEADRYLY